MKFAGIIFLIGLIVFFIWSRENKKGEIKKEKPVEKKEEKNGPKKKIWDWKKKSLYIWLFIFQFIVLNFVYPGGWFEVKTIFWFFATRNSDKFVAIKKINRIMEEDAKQKISSIQKEIQKIEDKEKITNEDKAKLGELANEVVNVGKPKRPKTLVEKPVPTPPIIWDWTFEWEATPEQLRRNSNQEKGRINDARVVFRDEKVLKFNYKRPSGKLVELTLSRNDSVKEFYQGKVSQPDLYLRVWLISDEKGNLRGTADNGPNTTQMEVFLKKKL